MQGIEGPWCVITCVQCGSEFRRKQWQMRTPRAGRFCSVQCSRTVTGPEHNHWKGGGTIHSNGYRKVWVDGEYQWEHRLVLERLLGRQLLKSESVHHLNGDKLDNRPENLRIMETHRAHMDAHAADIRARGARMKNRPNPRNSARMKARWADPVERRRMLNDIRRGKGLRPLADP